MKIFIQKNNGNLKESSFIDLLNFKLQENLKDIKSIKIEKGEFTDNSGSWIEINREKNNKEISVIISLNGEGSEITDVNVYSTPIKKVIDSDNTERLT